MQRIVVDPITGKIPNETPSATLNASFSGDSPCFKKFISGVINARSKKFFIE